MDEETLNELLLNMDGRQFWVVLWGDPELDPYSETMNFNEPVIEHWFPMHPASIKPGSILFVHRIHFSNIIFVAETISLARRVTDEEIRNNPQHERWAWSINTKNLTPTFGMLWRELNLKTFVLSREYNELHPEDRITLGRLNFGAPARISSGFARFLLKKIASP